MDIMITSEPLPLPSPGELVLLAWLRDAWPLPAAVWVVAAVIAVVTVLMIAVGFAIERRRY